MPTPDDNFVSEVFAQFADHPGTPTDEDLIGQWPELRTRPELLAAVRERFRVVHDLERRLFGGLSVRRPVSSPPEPLRGLAEAHGYAIERELGRGGMGVVYLARRRQDGRPVALKTMQGAGGAALDRFKREFRQLATLRHPNLVELYELVSDGGQWFSVMEYVAGGHFLAHVRLPLAAASCATTEDYVETSEEVEFFPGAPQVPGPLVFDEARLRDGLRQLAEGVAALHAAGKLHLDVKPSNVLVGGDGRVKLADFGLVAELGPEGSLTLPGGTPHYMAPEQCPGAGGRVSAASDWYGVGSLLFEALTGRVPFEGPPGRVMADKQRAEPPSPAALVPGLPADLCLLCADLLRRDPSARPDGREVMRRLGVVAAPPAPPTEEALLVGRDFHLAALRDALEAARAGRTVVVRVHGGSGAGKTALVRRFLDSLRGRGEAVVLAGRCYERESVPYKALDSLIDALGRFLRRLPQAEAARFLPRHADALARLFPVLLRVPGVAEAAAEAGRRPSPAPDPHEIRRRAFGALRELFARLGDRTPLVLAVDDLQWGDADSARLLGETLRPPDAPALLLLAGYRREEAATAPFLREFLATCARPESGLDVRDLPVDPLGEADALALASRLLGGGDARGRAEALVRETEGNPFLLCEVAEHVRSEAPAAEVGLEQVIAARLGRVPAGARRLLEAVAVAGRPLAEEEAFQAADLPPEEQQPALEALRAARLVRGTGPEAGGEVEAYHDRIRDAVLAGVGPAELPACHRRVALALETSRRGEPEELAAHYRAAGEAGRAAAFFAEAAEQSARALAFDRAAEQLRLALELLPADDPGCRDLLAKLGDALTNAGRGAEAATPYEAAAKLCTEPEAFVFRQKATEQLIRHGHIAAGVAGMREVLRQAGLRMPQTPRGALWAFRLRTAWLRLRGLWFRPRRAEQIAPEELLRVDVARWVSAGMALVDTVQGYAFQALHLLLALRAGEPYRIVQALAREMTYALHPRSGRAQQRRAERIRQLALATADRLENAEEARHARAVVELQHGTGQFVAGRFPEALKAFTRADELLRDCTGASVAHERAINQMFRMATLSTLGEWAEHARQFPALLRDARERVNRFAATSLPLLAHGGYPDLAADRPEEARRLLREAIKGWNAEGFHQQHHWGAYGEAEILIYEGRAEEALAHVRQTWPKLTQNLVLRIQLIRMVWHWLRGRCALAVAARTPGAARPLLREAERDARRIRRERTEWGEIIAKLLLAGVAEQRGGRAEALRLLGEADEVGQTVGTRMFAAAARRRRGQLLGGAEGQAIVAGAEGWMATQGVRNPARVTGMFAPGFPGLD